MFSIREVLSSNILKSDIKWKFLKKQLFLALIAESIETRIISHHLKRLFLVNLGYILLF